MYENLSNSSFPGLRRAAGWLQEFNRATHGPGLALADRNHTGDFARPTDPNADRTTFGASTESDEKANPQPAAQAFIDSGTDRPYWGSSDLPGRRN